MTKIISDRAIKRRQYWIEEIRKLSGNFGDDTGRLEKELETEIEKDGVEALIDHLRLCGNIPESYGHDSSEEKLYSKYTDSLLSLTFKYLGLKSLVLKERGDSADVEVFADAYGFVADAKAFRISRTATNPKDFKIQAMHGWKRGKEFAMVVCPIYQAPSRTSQIYEQATTSNVCIFTYSHLALLLNFSQKEGVSPAQDLLLTLFKTIPALNPSKNAIDYWLAINRTTLGFSKVIDTLWGNEKEAASESLNISKEEALTYLAKERERIMRMGHDEALKELLLVHRIECKIQTIEAMSDNGLFNVK